MLGFLGMLWKRLTGGDGKWRLLPVFVISLWVFAGGLCMRVEVNRLARVDTFGLDGERVILTGILDSVTDKNGKFILRVNSCSVWKKEGNPASTYTLRGVQVMLRGSEVEHFAQETSSWKIGNHVQIEGILQRFSSARNPGGFDYEGYCRAMKLEFSMIGESIVCLDRRFNAYREFLRGIHFRAKSTLSLITEGTDTGIYQAAILGDKTELEEEVQELYQRSGIAHLLAISGLHLSLIGMLIYGGLRKAGLGYLGAGMGGGILIVSYACLTGASPSVLRATIMLLCGFLASFRGRTYDLLSSLGLAAIMILWSSPLLVTQAGVQLSFGAILGIGYVLPIAESVIHGVPSKDHEAGKSKIIRIIGTGFLASISIQLVTTPVLLYHFFQIPLYGVLLNLLVIPLMGYVVASGIGGILLGLLHQSAGAFFIGTGHYILVLYELLCRQSGRLWGNNLVFGRPEWWQIVLYYGIIFGVFHALKCAWITKTGRQIALMSGTALFATLILLPIPVRNMEITILDVGQGDGICIRTNGATILVDGGSSDEKKVGADFLEPYFKSQGITTIDYAFVSHGDADHISGLLYLMREGQDIAVKNLVLPILGKGDEAYQTLLDSAVLLDCNVIWMGAGDSLEIDKLKINCLYPGKSDLAKDRNEQSMVLHLKYGAFTMMFTGDMSQEGEAIVLEQGKVTPVTVLKLAHHGSRFSNSEAWLVALQPSWAVVSYGDGNSYGHPHQEVTDRLRASKVPLLCTAESGAICIRSDGKQIRWSTFLP